jgi:phosphoglycerate dehydrogenase-like enzyme
MKRIALPDAEMIARLRAVEGAEYVVAVPGEDDLAGVDLLVPPYMSPPALLAHLAGSTVAAVQSQSVGYDGVADVLPAGITFHNAAGVHESSTAELAVGLTIAALRGIPAFAANQATGDWAPRRNTSLADRRVLVIGAGGVGRGIVERLRPFESEVTVVGRTARDGVRGIDELPVLLPRAEVVILAVPFDPSTDRLVDAEFLAALPDGALVVNVSRGGVVDTDALVAEASQGRIRAALDVTSPEPLPPQHPLWRSPGVLITPHVGGNSTAMGPRIDRLVSAQVERLVAGESLANRVLPL